MKKITLLLFTLVTTMSFAQQKTTGNVNFLQNLNANFTLDNSNSTACWINFFIYVIYSTTHH